MKRTRLTLVSAYLLLPLLALLGPIPGAAAEDEEDDPVRARAFEVRHRPLADAAEVVGAILSEDATLTLNGRLRTLVIEDRASVLDRVKELLESFDQPPRSVEVTLTLFFGTDESKTEAGKLAVPPYVRKEVIDMMDKLSEIMKWTSYEVLGSRSIVGVEGGRATATLSDDYRIVFEIDSVDEVANKVRFKTLSVQKIVPTADGGVRYQEVYTAATVSNLGRLTLVGAATGPDSHKALFLTLQAESR